MTDLDSQRLLIKVARLYHTHGLRQTDIAKRLSMSQSRVSRLLTQAEDAGIVRTVVAVPADIHADLEEAVENRYGVSEVHVVDAVSSEEGELSRDLAQAMASLLEQVTFEVPTIGVTSWSTTIRQVVQVMQPLRTKTEHVVEMLGDLGPPSLQHAVARSTQRLATLSGGQPVFLRVPGVVPSEEARTQLLSQDAYAQEALAMLDSMDLALVGIGANTIDPVLRAGDNFFSEEQFEEARALGAAGEICLHFIDGDGVPIGDDLDGLIIGASLDQLRSAKHRWTVAGGRRKRDAVRAALRGHWIDTLVTDRATAEFLAEN